MDKTSELSKICISQYCDENIIKKMNMDLLEFLNGSANQMLRDAKKHGQTLLPNQEKLEVLLEKTQEYLIKLNPKREEKEFIDLSAFDGNPLFAKIINSMSS